MWTQRIPWGGVLALAYAPDGRTLYTADTGGWVLAWNLAAHERTPLFRLPTINREKVCALHVLDGRYLVVDLRDRAWSWDLAEWKRGRRDLPGGSNGMRPGPAGPFVRYLTHNTLGRNAVRSFDVRTGKTTAIIPTTRGLTDTWQFAFSPDDSRLVAYRFLSTPVLLDLSAGRPVSLPELAHDPDEVHFSPDGRFVVWGGSAGVEVWDAATVRREARGEPKVRARAVRCCAPPGGLALHPTAPILAGLDLITGHLTLFSLDTGDPIRSLDFALGRSVRCVAFSPDGLTCAVGGSNKQFAVFDVDL